MLEIKLTNLFLSSALKSNLDYNTAYQLALSSGDDYELCLTAPLRNHAAFEKAADTITCPVTCVDKITSGSVL